MAKSYIETVIQLIMQPCVAGSHRYAHSPLRGNVRRKEAPALGHVHMEVLGLLCRKRQAQT